MHQDANEALVKGLDLQAMLNAAAPSPHEQIVKFQVGRGARMLGAVAVSHALSATHWLALLAVPPQDLQEEVFRELSDPVSVSGTPFRTLPGLQKLLKVWAGGELWCWRWMVVPPLAIALLDVLNYV